MVQAAVQARFVKRTPCRGLWTPRVTVLRCDRLSGGFFDSTGGATAPVNKRNGGPLVRCCGSPWLFMASPFGLVVVLVVCEAACHVFALIFGAHVGFCIVLYGGVPFMMWLCLPFWGTTGWPSFSCLHPFASLCGRALRILGGSHMDLCEGGVSP